MAASAKRTTSERLEGLEACSANALELGAMAKPTTVPNRIIFKVIDLYWRMGALSVIELQTPLRLSGMGLMGSRL
jgi:hypothetical protein